MITSENISENLFAFYKQIVDKTNSGLNPFSGLEIISTPDKSWPAYVVSKRLVEEDEVAEISKKMKLGEYPPFWIRKTEKSDNFEALALSFGIRQINSWKGMAMEKNEAYNMPAPLDNLVFEHIQQSEKLDSWMEVVNSEIMTGRKISRDVFKDLPEKEALDFFQLRLDGEVVSTILMYTIKGISGIYLVSTKEKFRGKSLGKFITSRAVDFYIQRACTKFVLHSTKLGYPLYNKLGFQTVCDYGIYWMVGKI